MEAYGSSSGIDSAVEEELGKLQIQSGFWVPEILDHELRFLEGFIWCLQKRKKGGKYSNLLSSVTSLVKNSNLLSSVTSLSEILIEEDWRSEPLNLFEKFESKIREDCAVLLDSLKSISWSIKEIQGFIMCLVSNLKGLSNLETDIFVSVKDQIMALKNKFSFLEILLSFIAKNCTNLKKWKEFLDTYVMNWVHDATTLSLVCLLKGKDENVPEILETILSDLLQKIKFCSSNPEVMGMFIQLLKDSKPSRSDKLLVGQIVAGLVDLLFESVVSPLKDYVEILRDGLIFMMALFMDPMEKAGGTLSMQINVVVNEVLSLLSSLNMDELKVDLSMREKVCLSSLEYKIDKVKIEIQKLINVQVSYPSDFNFPGINSLWFIDSFLENMKEMVKPNSMIAFARHQVVIVREEVLFLKPFLKEIMEGQKQRTDLKDLWNRIMNKVFLAEYVIASCSFVDHPIWYDMLRLPDVIQAIKIMKNEVREHNVLLASTNTNSSDIPKKQANDSSFLQDFVVGMKEESEELIDKLIGGTKQLDIVSIVGMAGLGKTTLARKVYTDPHVSHHFDIRAWCCVSQVYNERQLYFDILSDVRVAAGKYHFKTSDADLAELLWKSLLQGQRYLVVFDDIWSIEAWDNMKRSFPDKNEGSRILFTSRIRSLVSADKLILLRTLSNEDSRELFKRKLSHNDLSPPDGADEIAENIVKNCQGLPLAVVLIAGVLAGTNLEFWKQIETRVTKVVSDQGCKDAVKLSYEHLPDHLKPCFLYFGAFPEDRVVKSRELMNLWIAEGFIPRSDKRTVHKVAETYLSDLVSRSLVISAERSSSGGIKACRVHDVLHELCLEKMQEENFLQLVQKNDVPQSSLNPKENESCRLGVHDEWLQHPLTVPAGGPLVRSIICVSYYDYNQPPWPYGTPPFNLSLFEPFKLLNVLNVALIPKRIDFLDAGISFMVHLRYLSICACEGHVFPESIANLWNLETLIVGLGFLELPSSFWKMKSLRYVNTRAIISFGMESRDEYSRLENMDTFACPYFDSRDEMKEMSRRLPGLRELKCEFGLSCRDGTFKFQELSWFTDLETLNMRCYNEVNWLERQPFATFDFPNSLKKLTLKGFKLAWRAISIIGQLPNLEILKLKDNAFPGTKWDTGDGEFLKLKFLELYFLKIEQWTIPDDDPFPCLELLKLRHCRKLEGIPSSLGDICTLQRIEVIDCSQAATTSAMDILQQQRDGANDILQVFCIKSY